MHLGSPDRLVSTQPVAGKITRIENSVLGRTSDDPAWRAQIQNGAVFDDDEIFTNDASRALVEFNSGGTLAIEEKSLVRIRLSTRTEIDVEVERGTVLAEFQSDAKRKLAITVGGLTSVQTSEAVVVRASSLGATPELAVVDGSLRTAPQAESPALEVKAGDVATMADSGAQVVAKFDPVQDSVASEMRAFAKAEEPTIMVRWPRDGQSLPAAACAGATARPVYLAWDATDAGPVKLEVATDPDFSTIVQTQSGAASPVALRDVTARDYHWRLTQESGAATAGARFTVTTMPCEAMGLAALAAAPAVETAPVEETLAVPVVEAPVAVETPAPAPMIQKTAKPKKKPVAAPVVASVISTPAVVFGIAVDTETPLLARLAWQAEGASQRYEIQVASDSVFDTLVAEESSDETSADVDLSEGVYHARVRGISPDATPGPWVATAAFRVELAPMVKQAEPSVQSPRRLVVNAAYMPSLIDYDYTSDGIENEQRMIVERGADVGLQYSWDAFAVQFGAHGVYDPSRTADETSNAEEASGDEGLGIYREFAAQLAALYRRPIGTGSWGLGLAYAVESLPVLTFGEADDVGYVNTTINKMSLKAQWTLPIMAMTLRNTASAGGLWSMAEKDVENVGSGGSLEWRTSVGMDVMDGYGLSVGGIAAIDRLDLGVETKSRIERTRVSGLVGLEVRL
jgi:hypothetical protein